MGPTWVETTVEPPEGKGLEDVASRAVLSNMGLAVSVFQANPPLLEPGFLGSSAVKGKGLYLPDQEPHHRPYQVIQSFHKPLWACPALDLTSRGSP